MRYRFIHREKGSYPLTVLCQVLQVSRSGYYACVSREMGGRTVGPDPIMLAEVHPRVETQIRATYLSLQSFAGRLAFAVCLAISSRAVAGLETSHETMARVLWVYLACGLLLGVALVWTARRGR